MNTNTTHTVRSAVESLRDFGYDNNLELSIIERDDQWFFSIDNWNNDTTVEGSFPTMNSTPSLILSFIRARMVDLIAEAGE